MFAPLLVSDSDNFRDLIFAVQCVHAKCMEKMRNIYIYIYINFMLENLNGSINFRGLTADGMTIFKWILNQLVSSEFNELRKRISGGLLSI